MTACTSALLRRVHLPKDKHQTRPIGISTVEDCGGGVAGAGRSQRNNAYYFFYGLDGQGLHGVKTPALYFDVGSAGHTSWLTDSNVIRIARKTMVAWLKSCFHGESLDQYFIGLIVQKDVTAGYIVAVDTE